MRERKDDGFPGFLKSWGPFGGSLLLVGGFIIKVNATVEKVPSMDTKLDAVIQAAILNRQDIAVQDEKIRAILDVLTDIHDDLRYYRDTKKD